jgi:hypothetical protein
MVGDPTAQLPIANCAALCVTLVPCAGFHLSRPRKLSKKAMPSHFAFGGMHTERAHSHLPELSIGSADPELSAAIQLERTGPVSNYPRDSPPCGMPNVLCLPQQRLGITSRSDNRRGLRRVLAAVPPEVSPSRRRRVEWTNRPIPARAAWSRVPRAGEIPVIRQGRYPRSTPASSHRHCSRAADLMAARWRTYYLS